MARLTDTQTRVFGTYFSDIQWAVERGYLSTDVVAGIAAGVRDLGGSIDFTEAQAIATLYGYANRMSKAAAEFSGADLDQAITGDMIGVPPWARDEQVMNTSPIWHATFYFEGVDAEGNQTSGYRTSIFEMTLPETVGELTDAINEDAELMASQRGGLGSPDMGDLTTVQPISLWAV